MKAGIIVFPGINRERDMAIALERSGARPRMIWHKETDLAGLDLIVIPGGTSPDHMRRDEHMVRLVREAAAAQIPMAAICHGPWMLCSTTCMSMGRDSNL